VRLIIFTLLSLPVIYCDVMWPPAEDPYHYSRIIQKYERDHQIDKLRGAVRLIIFTLLSLPPGSCLLNSSWGVDKLCISIEHILLHGLQVSHFWRVICLLSNCNEHTQTIQEEMQRFTRAKDDTAKGRVWIRWMLNKKILGRFLDRFVNHDMLSSTYHSWAVVRTSPHKDVLVSLLKEIENFNFLLKFDELSDLDTPIEIVESRMETAQHVSSPVPLPPSENDLIPEITPNDENHNYLIWIEDKSKPENLDPFQDYSGNFHDDHSPKGDAGEAASYTEMENLIGDFVQLNESASETSCDLEEFVNIATETPPDVVPQHKESCPTLQGTFPKMETKPTRPKRKKVKTKMAQIDEPKYVKK